MAKIGLPKGSGKRLKVREKSVKSQGILKWILSGNPAGGLNLGLSLHLHPYFVYACSKAPESPCICTDMPESSLLADASIQNLVNCMAHLFDQQSIDGTIFLEIYLSSNKRDI